MFAVIQYSAMMGALLRIQTHVAALAQNMIPKRVRIMRHNLYVMTDGFVQRRRAKEPAYTDFMTHLLSAEKAGKLVAPEVLAQAPIIVIAGSETTATLLSGGTFHLLTNPHVYDRVVSEVRNNFSSQKDINLVSINELKYFLAFFDEALRMYPPVAGNVSRVTPPEGTTIAGKWVPGNTTVGIHQYAQFHSAENFANPDAFAPERFLEVDDPKWRENKRNAL
jgi:cytochrome P450